MDDLESQASGASCASRGPVEEWVGTTLSPLKASQWQAKIGTKPVGPGGHYNPHGMLAAQRYVMERYACEELLLNAGAIVVDVGAAPHRTDAHLGQRGRYMMPTVHVGDRSRVARAPPSVAARVCHHLFEECRCYDGQRRAYLFTHSAYYLDPSVLWLRLRDPDVVDAIVVEHYFDDVFGGYYDEANWSVDAGILKMSVSGNGQPYVHLLPPWQCGWVGGNGEAFVAEVLKTLDGVTRVVRLEAVLSEHRFDEMLTWREVEANPNRSGPVQFSSAVRSAVADNARFTNVVFDCHHVRAFGPILYTDFVFRGESVRVTLPVNGVSQVAAIVANRPRTPELLAEVSHVMKNRYARARVPPAKMAQTLTAMIALGFVVNLNVEIDTHYTMLERFSWAMKIHSVLLQFGSVSVRRWPWVLAIFLLSLIVVVPVEVLEHDIGLRVVAAFLGVCLPMLCVCCVWGTMRLHRSWRDYLTAGWVASYSSDESPTTPLLGNGFTFRQNFPLPGSRYLRPDPEVLQGDLRIGATRERVFEPERMLISGIVTDGAMPNALATTQDAERCAVTNRILAPRENPTGEALQAHKEVFQRKEFAVECHVDTGFPAVARWLSKLRATYPETYIAGLLDAWKQNQGVEPPPVATKGFEKIEKSAATIGVDGQKSTKARLIQPPEDIDKVMTGPVVWQLYEAVRDAWDGIQSSVLYASGRSLAYVGSCVDAFIGAHGVVVAWSLDMATYDATLGYDVQEPSFDWYCRLGMPTFLKGWLTRVRSRGTTPNGVSYAPKRYYAFEDEEFAKLEARRWREKKFKVDGPFFRDGEEDGPGTWNIVVEDFQMTSGRMDTNLTDTVCLVAAVLAKMPDVPYLLLACGDDGFLMLRKGDEWVVGPIIAHMRGLGLKPEGKISESRADWEFCSKLFWYGTDLATGKVQTVLGSKPFRGVSRMGVNTTLPGAANAAASALAVRVDSGHVPFLGAFADRTYELCRNARMRPRGKVEWSALRGDKRYGPSALNYTITQERYGLGEENEREFKLKLADLNSVPIVLQYAPLLNAVRRDEE